MGIVLFAIQKIFHVLMSMFHLEKDLIMNMSETSVILNFFEKIFGTIFIVHIDAELFSVFDKREKFLLTNFFWLGNIFQRSSKYICEDAIFSCYVSTILCSYWNLET